MTDTVKSFSELADALQPELDKQLQDLVNTVKPQKKGMQFFRGKDLTPHHLKPNDTLPAFVHPKEKPLSEITAAVDAQDVALQEVEFSRMLSREVRDKADRLRHRADMMRRRAIEFDNMADDAEKGLDDALSSNGAVVKLVYQIEDLLYEYAHIEPKRTEFANTSATQTKREGG